MAKWTNFDLVWCPDLFSCQGAGFENDPTLQNGVHLRWTFHPGLGLPFQRGATKNGSFVVKRLKGGEAPLKEILLKKLFGTKGWVEGSPADASGVGLKRHLENPGHTIYQFWYQVLTPFSFRYLRPQLDYYHELLTSQPEALSTTQLALLNHYYEVLKHFPLAHGKPGPARAPADVCAVDIHFKFEGVLPRVGRREAYVSIQGFDRHGALVAVDWVGRKSAARKLKLLAQLRAPGIRRVMVKQIPNRPHVEADFFHWVFCESYCGAPIWQDDGVEVLLDGEPKRYGPTWVQGHLYEPFQKSPPSDAATRIRTQVIANPEFQKVFKVSPFWQAQQNSKVGTSAPAGEQQLNIGFNLPLLPTLLTSAVEPLMARILGLYHFDNESSGRTDFKVEADFPFFQSPFVETLKDNFIEVLRIHGFKEPALTETVTRLVSLTRANSNLILSGLVLSPVRRNHPPPPEAPNFNQRTAVKIYPSQLDPGRPKIVVQTRFDLPRQATRTPVTRTHVAYRVDRLNAPPWVNTIEQDPNDLLGELGILPPVHMARVRDETNKIRIRDTFQLASPRDRDLRYRFIAHDLFGRPSPMRLGDATQLDIPCDAPNAPIQLSADLNKRDGALELDLFFCLIWENAVMQAQPHTLRVFWHWIPESEPANAQDYRWNGVRFARGLIARMLQSQGRFLLDTKTARPGCFRLTWIAGELRFGQVDDGECDSDFPDLPLDLGQYLPPKFAQADRNFEGYRLKVPVGVIDQMPPGLARLAVRMVVSGACSFSRTRVHSSEVVVSAERRIPPPIPVTVQPPLDRVPTSTYPDALGDSYYGLDLTPFLPPAERAGKPLLKILSTTLERLTDQPEAIVEGEFLMPDAMVNLAPLVHQQQTRFASVTAKPHRYQPGAKRFTLKVKGDRDQVHVVAVTPTNVYLMSEDWAQARFFLFRTPGPQPAAVLYHTSTRKQVSQGSFSARLLFESPFPAELPADETPRIQVIREDLSLQQTTFLGDVEGVWDNQSSRYQFDLLDDNVPPWRQFVYRAQLLTFSPSRGFPLKSGDPAAVRVNIRSETAPPPLQADSPVSVAALSPVGRSFEFSILAGEFQIGLTKITPDRESTTQRGRLTRGMIDGLPDATLEIEKASGNYRLLIQDLDPVGGHYTLRLHAGGQFSWSRTVEDV